MAQQQQQREYVLAALRQRMVLQQQIETLTKEREQLDQQFIEWMDSQNLRNIRLGDGTTYSVRSAPDINISQKTMEPIVRKYIRNVEDADKCLSFAFSNGRMAQMQRLSEYMTAQQVQHVMREFDQLSAANGRRRFLTKSRVQK